MINIMFTVASLVVLSVAILTRGGELISTQQLKHIQNVLSQQIEVTPEPSNNPTSIPTITPTPTVASTSTPEVTLTPQLTSTPTQEPKASVTPVSNWRYPDSNVSFSSENKLTLSSSSDPKLIVTWYRNKIQTEGFHTTSMIQTSTNGKILDKMVAADGSKELRVEISRDSGSTICVIEVELTVDNSTI